MPTSMIATISNEVATGRRINSRDGLTPCSYPKLAFAQGGAFGASTIAIPLPYRRGRVGGGAGVADSPRRLSPAATLIGSAGCLAAGRRAVWRLAIRPLGLTLPRGVPARPARLGRLLARLRRLRAAFGNRDLGAFLEPVGAVGDDDLARLQPLGDGDLLAVVGAERHRLRGHRVVGFDNVDEGAGRAALDRRVRHDVGALQRVDLELDVDELVREQVERRVGEGRAQLRRAGRRVDLIVDRRELAHFDLR